MEQIILQGITAEQLISRFEATIDRKLDEFAKVHFPERMLTAKEACNVLGVSFNTLKGYVMDGIVEQITTGGDPRYSLKELSKVTRKRK